MPNRIPRAARLGLGYDQGWRPRCCLGGGWGGGRLELDLGRLYCLAYTQGLRPREHDAEILQQAVLRAVPGDLRDEVLEERARAPATVRTCEVESQRLRKRCHVHVYS